MSEVMEKLAFGSSTLAFLDAVRRGKHRKAELSRLRKLVWLKEAAEQGGVYCFCCGGSLAKKSATLEHIKPKSKGGLFTLDNLALSHAECNVARGNSETQRANPPHQLKAAAREKQLASEKKRNPQP